MFYKKNEASVREDAINFN